MGAYLEAFEATAQAGKWSCNQWAIILRSSLSGAGLTAVASMPADQQRTMKLLEASCFGNITSTARPTGVGFSRLPSPPPIQMHG